MRRFLLIIIESLLLWLCGFFALYVRVLGDTAYELIERPGCVKLVVVTLAVEVALATLERRNAGFHIVGFADNTPELVGKSLINPTVIGLTDDIVDLVERYEVDRIVVAVEDRRGKFPTAELLDLSLSGRVAVEECAQYYERLTGKIASEMLRPSWLIFSRNSRFSNVANHARRGRPVFVAQLEKEIPYYSQRHLVKPGLTGWAQIKYSYGASVEDAMEKLRYDLYYIKNQNLLLDAGIVFETVKTVLFGRGR